MAKNTLKGGHQTKWKLPSTLIGAKTVSAARAGESGAGGVVGGVDLQYPAVDPIELAPQPGAGEKLDQETNYDLAQSKISSNWAENPL